MINPLKYGYGSSIFLSCSIIFLSKIPDPVVFSNNLISLNKFIIL